MTCFCVSLVWLDVARYFFSPCPFSFPFISWIALRHARLSSYECLTVGLLSTPWEMFLSSSVFAKRVYVCCWSFEFNEQIRGDIEFFSEYASWNESSGLDEMTLLFSNPQKSSLYLPICFETSKWIQIYVYILAFSSIFLLLLLLKKKKQKKS